MQITIYLILAIILFPINIIYVMDLALKTGISRPFEETILFTTKDQMLKKRYKLLIICGTFWIICSLSLTKSMYLTVPDSKTTDGVYIFFITLIAFAFVYIFVNAFTEKEFSLEEDIQNIGKKD